MSFEALTHDCNWYCAGDIHAHVVLARSEARDGDVAHTLRQLGADVVEVRPMLEADMEQLRQTLTDRVEGDTSSLRRATPQDYADHTQPFLVLLREAVQEPR